MYTLRQRNLDAWRLEELEVTQSKAEYAIRFGDTALVLSHRLSEWCGKGPALEEDMALANVALDLLGQARLWLSYAGEIEGAGRDEDELAYHRNGGEYRNFLLAEQPNGNYAETTLRQFYFDVWHGLALERLLHSTDLRIREIAEKARKEVMYHLRRSSDLVIRLGDGTALSHRMMQDAADTLWPWTGELFTRDALDVQAVDAGFGFDPEALKQSWIEKIGEVFAHATLRLPSLDTWMHEGGKRGVHTEHLSYLLGEMQVLQRSYRGAKW